MTRAPRLIGILWPSFVVAGVAEIVFFTVFDPVELHLLGDPVAVGPMAAYTIGFFVFWAFTAASSAFTCFLQRGAEEVNTLGPIDEASARAAGGAARACAPARD